MKIRNITTIRFADWQNLIWVEIEAEDGISGLGESFRGAAAIESHIHEVIAPQLIGMDSFDLARINRLLLNPYVGYRSSSAEIRAASAIDLALWDLLGKRLDQPCWQLIGGAAHDRMATYNTCVGPRYNTSGGRREISADETPAARYDDQITAETDAGSLARDLLSEGIRAMKIWPFDRFAAKRNGLFIDRNDIELGLQPVHAIRDAVGRDMTVLIECHGLWEPAAALAIASALEPYDVFCMEDPIRPSDPHALADLRRRTSVPIMVSETFGGRAPFLDALRLDALDYAMIDLSWCGGLTEAIRIASLADSFQRPVAPHDCTGPVVYAASLHMAFATPNCIFQESVRAYYHGWYQTIADGVPIPEHGFFEKPKGPGFGLRPKTDGFQIKRKRFLA